MTETDPSNMSIQGFKVLSLKEMHDSLELDLIDENRRSKPDVVAIKSMKRKVFNI